MKVKAFIIGLVSLWVALPVQANAAQPPAAKMECADAGCSQYELRVTIPTDSDAGRQGAYGIFAISVKEGRTASWTEEGSWAPYTGDNLIKPVAPGLRKLQATRDFIVFKGAADRVCQTSGGQSFNLYAWHATLPAAEIQRVGNFLQAHQIAGWQAENFWNSMLLFNANKQGNVKLVYSAHCAPAE